MTEQRFIDLETRLAYQEAALETLSEELARQQRLVEQLQKALRRVSEQLPNEAEGAVRGSLFDELPPHY